MHDLVGLKTTIELKCGVVELLATGRVVQSAGFTQLYQDASEGEGEAQMQPLPEVAEGQMLTVLNAKAEAKSTPAPSRFSEAALVRTLEKVGVGRPSTYASILSVLDARGYTRVVKRQLTVTWLGLLVATYLETHFPLLVNTAFTASMEEELDRIAAGGQKREAYLHQFWTQGLAPMIGQAGRAAPIIHLPRVPGAVVTVRGQSIVLMFEGKTGVLNAEIIPEDLTPTLAAQVLNSQSGQRSKENHSSPSKKKTMRKKKKATT